MGSINIDNTGSGSDVTLSSDGTSLLLDGSAVGGGSSTLAIDSKTAAYTVVSADLGKIINCTSGTFTVSLTSAATLGAGFYCWVYNTTDSASNFLVTIDPAGSETIGFQSTYELRQAEGVKIVSDGTNWLISDARDTAFFVQNFRSAFSARAQAAGLNSTSIGRGTDSTGAESFAAGQNSGGGGSQALGTAAMALGGSYASGTDSLAAAIANNTSSYGATGANSIAIGKQTKASNGNNIALGYSHLSTGSPSYSVGYNNSCSGNYSGNFGSNSTASNHFAYTFGDYCTASSQRGIAIGYSATASVDYEIALGGANNFTTISGAYSLPNTDGTSGQVLSTDGAGSVSWATAGGGAWNLIQTTEVTTSVSSIEFTGLSGYTQYVLLLDLSTGYSNVTMRFGIDGTYDSGSNYRNLSNSTGDSEFNINTSGYKYGAYGYVLITDLARSSTSNYRRTAFEQAINAFGSSSNSRVENYGGYWGQQNNNSIQLLGSFVNGSVSLYGVTK